MESKIKLMDSSTLYFSLKFEKQMFWNFDEAASREENQKLESSALICSPNVEYWIFWIPITERQSIVILNIDF